MLATIPVNRVLEARVLNSLPLSYRDVGEGVGWGGMRLQAQRFFLKSYYSFPNTREFGFSFRAILLLCDSTRHTLPSPPPLHHLDNLLAARSIRSTGVQIHLGNADACFRPTDTATTNPHLPQTTPLVL